tara:strand:- start:735 stop:842 length:108 start_codon:yes stop_codon:yes gene_type:complete
MIAKDIIGVKFGGCGIILDNETERMSAKNTIDSFL